MTWSPPTWCYRDLPKTRLVNPFSNFILDFRDCVTKKREQIIEVNENRVLIVIVIVITSTIITTLVIGITFINSITSFSLQIIIIISILIIRLITTT